VSKINKTIYAVLVFMLTGIFFLEGLAYSEMSYNKLRAPIGEETQKRFEEIYINALVGHSSLGGSVTANKLVFNLIGSEVRTPEVSQDENLRNLRLVLVKSTVDLGNTGEQRDIETMFIINTENGDVVGYYIIELSGSDIFSYSGKVFDSYRGKGYLERAIKLLLLSGRIEKWSSSYSLEKPEIKMYKRIRNDSRFSVEFAQPSRYVVRLTEATPHPLIDSDRLQDSSEAGAIKYDNELLESLRQNTMISRWNNVFAEFQKRAGKRADAYSAVTLFFYHRGEAADEYSIFIPKECNERDMENVLKYIAAMINNRMVSAGTSRVVLKTQIPGFFEKSRAYFYEYYDKSEAAAKVKEMAEGYFGIKQFEILNFYEKGYLPISEKSEIEEENVAVKTGDFINEKILVINIGKQYLKFGIAEIDENKKLSFWSEPVSIPTWEEGNDRADAQALFKRIIQHAKNLIRQSGLAEGQIKAIGLSLSVVVPKEKVLTVGTGFAEHFTPEGVRMLGEIAEIISREFNDVPVYAANDGDLEAFGVARTEGFTNTLVLKYGNELAAGFIDEEGGISDGVNEFTKMVIDFGDNAPVDNGTQIRGTSGQFISWLGINYIAQHLGVDKILQGMGLGENIPKVLSDALNEKANPLYEYAKIVYEKAGEYVAELAVEMSKSYPVQRVVISGGLVHGNGGEIILSVVKKRLEELHQSEIQAVRTDDLRTLRYGALIGAAYHVIEQSTAGRYKEAESLVKSEKDQSDLLSGLDEKRLIETAQRLIQYSSQTSHLLQKARAYALLSDIFGLYLPEYIHPLKKDDIGAFAVRQEKDLLNVFDYLEQYREYKKCYESISEVFLNAVNSTVRQAIQIEPREVKGPLRIPDELKNKKVTVKSPARFDLGVGLSSDLLLVTKLEGGAALNLAALLEGACPVQVELRPLRENVIKLRSVDLGVEETILNKEALLDLSVGHNPLRLLKAAIIASGIVTDQDSRSLEDILDSFGGGFEIVTSVSIEKGSGLGISSILAGAIVKALLTFSGQKIDERQLTYPVLWIEQRLGIGGGWQDLIGGLFPGVKWTVSEKGVISPVSEMLEFDDDFLQEMEQRIILWDTGIRRDNVQTGTLPQRSLMVLRRDDSIIRAREKAIQYTREMRDAIMSQDVNRLGRLLTANDTAKYSCSGIERNGFIAQAVETVQDLIEGSKELGAGGGGFSIFVAKKGQELKLIEKLNEIGKESGGRVYQWNISREGMKVFIEPLDDEGILKSVETHRSNI